MARCEHCGNVVPDGQAACPVCGAAMSNQGNNGYGGAGNQQYNGQAYNNQGYYNQGNNTYQNNAYQNNGYQNNVNSMDGQDYSYMYDPMDIANNKTMAVISYLGIFCLIPLFSNKTSRYARFHTAQGVNLLILEIIINIITRMGFRLSGLFLVGTLGSLLSIVTLVLAILGIVNAANGRAKELPLIGKMHILSLF